MWELILIVFLFAMASAVLMLAALWKIFEKAGEDGWKATIPFYNMIILLKVVGKPFWWAFMFLIPYANIVFIIITYNMLSKSFGKTSGFTVGLVLLGVVFFPILGFGQAQYLGPYANKAAFDEYNLRDFGKPENNN